MPSKVDVNIHFKISTTNSRQLNRGEPEPEANGTCFRRRERRERGDKKGAINVFLLSLPLRPPLSLRFKFFCSFQNKYDWP